MPRPVQLLLFSTRTVGFLERCANRYGDVFRLDMLGVGSSVFVTSPAAVRAIYERDRDHGVPSQAIVMQEAMFGRSLFLSEGASHLRKRRLLLPPFHGERLAAWRSTMIDTTRREIDRWPVGSGFSLAPRMAAITRDVIFEVIFGLRADSRQPNRQAQLRVTLTQMVDAAMGTGAELLGLFKRDSRWRRLPITPWGRLQRLIDRTHELLHEEISRRRADPLLSERNDVFSLLVQARDEAGEPMGDDELRDELVSLLLAGMQTTAMTLAWVFDFLLHDAEVLERLRDELARENEDFLDAVIAETMRLRPVVHMTTRRLRSPVELNGYALPAGTTVAIPAYLVHHRSDIYPDPESFKPERFLDQSPGTYEWVPFGGGMRRCIGASFAMMEMKSVISTVLTSVAMRPARQERERIRRRNIILVPAKGSRVIVDSSF